MMGRSAWPLLLIVGLASPWVGAAGLRGPAPDRRRRRRPILHRRTARRPTSPPSTVSPAIERFMKQTGQDLPPPSRLPAMTTPAAVARGCHAAQPRQRPCTPARARRRSATCRRPTSQGASRRARIRRRRRRAVAPGDRHAAQSRAVRCRPTSGSRSTWPRPCGSPTPGR